MKALDIYDKTVESLNKQGIAVILNNHMLDAKWCCGDDDGYGLWFN